MLGFLNRTDKTKRNHRAHVIVVGNEKGGSGKSTTAMHLIVALLLQGRSVASIDVDSRQGTLTRYIANREHFLKISGNEIKIPTHYTLMGYDDTATEAERDVELDRLGFLIEGAWVNHDAVVIDTPGSAGAMSRLAHSYADTLITPLNDSLVDFDVLAHVDGGNLNVKGPSHYAEMVWGQKKVRAERDGGMIDWIVMRNRLSSLDAHNKRQMDKLLKELAVRINFRVVPGLGERVIFRELFLAGLTILDLKDVSGPTALSPSHHAAREEVTTIINAIGLPPPPGSVVSR